MSDNASLLGFNGIPYDPVSGTYHLGNGYRTYSPVLKQFLSPDSMSPFGPGGINPYAYCAADPINHSDPSGHFHIGFMSVLGIVGVIAGVAAAPFTGGSSLALTAALGGAVLGTVSAGTGMAADNTTGSAHNTQAKISLFTGIAGGILDAGAIAGPAIARRLGAGLLNAARKVAGVAEEGRVFTFEGRYEGAALPAPNEALPVSADPDEWGYPRQRNLHPSGRFRSLSDGAPAEISVWDRLASNVQEVHNTAAQEVFDHALDSSHISYNRGPQQFAWSMSDLYYPQDHARMGLLDNLSHATGFQLRNADHALSYPRSGTRGVGGAVSSSTRRLLDRFNNGYSGSLEEVSMPGRDSFIPRNEWAEPSNLEYARSFKPQFNRRYTI